jgi:hypothetical protein
MATSAVERDTSGSPTHPLLWLGPMLYVFLIGLYFIARTGGYWAEADSSAFATIIRAVVAEGRLVPSSGEYYPNGYTFQSVSAFIVSLTGMNVQMLQQITYPLLASLVVLPAWLLFREFGGNARMALLATFLLFTQPEFLFVILRSSHEKFTRMLMLLCLFLLVRSLRSTNRPQLTVAYIVMFYVAAFALITSNNLLAHSFIFAIGVALFAGWLLERRSRALYLRSHGAIVRLQYVVFTCIALVYIFTFYLYWPAQQEFAVIKSVWEHVTALLFGGQTSANTQAYGVVSIGWISVRVYLALTVANWIVLLVSAAIWSRQGYRWLWRKQAPESQARWLLWLLYGAFATQGALAIIIDMSGAITSNMQQRLFPSISIFAVAIVATAISEWRPRRFAGVARAGLAASLAAFAVLSIFKATNEPLVSNNWMFYHPSEVRALAWSDARLHDAEIWTDYNERLVVAYETDRGRSANNNRMFGARALPPTARNAVVSSVVHLRSSRLGLMIPVPADAMRVYDNGETQVYHLRPSTPFQQ